MKEDPSLPVSFPIGQNMFAACLLTCEGRTNGSVDLQHWYDFLSMPNHDRSAKKYNNDVHFFIRDST